MGRGTKLASSRSSHSYSSARPPSDVDVGGWGASHFLGYGKRIIPTPRADVDVSSLLNSLAGKQGRKYSLESVRLSLEAILEGGVSTTQASEMYGINRSTLQFYLKKLNVVRRRWRKPQQAAASSSSTSQ